MNSSPFPHSSVSRQYDMEIVSQPVLFIVIFSGMGLCSLAILVYMAFLVYQRHKDKQMMVDNRRRLIHPDAWRAHVRDVFPEYEGWSSIEIDDIEDVVQAPDIHEAPALQGIEILNLPWAVLQFRFCFWCCLFLWQAALQCFGDPAGAWLHLSGPIIWLTEADIYGH